MNTVALDNFEAANMSELSEVQGGFSWQDAISCSCCNTISPFRCSSWCLCIMGNYKTTGHIKLEIIFFR